MRQAGRWASSRGQLPEVQTAVTMVQAKEQHSVLRQVDYSACLTEKQLEALMVAKTALQMVQNSATQQVERLAWSREQQREVLTVATMVPALVEH